MTELTIADTVHSSVVRAADCRSACPWFNSGWRSWFTLMTWSSKLTSQIIQMINITSPIRTITRKSVNMVAELRNGTEDYSAVAKATTATAVALDTKASWLLQWIFSRWLHSSHRANLAVILWWTGCSGSEPTLVLKVPQLFTLSA